LLPEASGKGKKDTAPGGEEGLTRGKVKPREALTLKKKPVKVGGGSDLTGGRRRRGKSLRGFPKCLCKLYEKDLEKGGRTYRKRVTRRQRGRRDGHNWETSCARMRKKETPETNWIWGRNVKYQGGGGGEAFLPNL